MPVVTAFTALLKGLEEFWDPSRSPIFSSLPFYFTDIEYIEPDLSLNNWDDTLL